MNKTKRFLVSLSSIFIICNGIQPVFAQEENEASVSFTFPDNFEIEPGSRVAVVTKNVSGVFWKHVKKGMEVAVADLNTYFGFTKGDQIVMTFEGPKSEEDIAGQINTIDAVLAENPDILCIAAGDMTSCEAQLETAEENGIPVIMFDSDVITDLSAAFLGTDNYMAGIMAAEKIAKAMGEIGNVVVFAHQEKTETSVERASAFLEKIGCYPNIQVKDVFYSDQEEDVYKLMSEYLENNEDISGIFCTNEEMATAFMTVLSEQKEREYVVATIDLGEGEEQAIREGRVLGAVMQKPFELGYDTIIRAVEVLGGMEVVRLTYYEPYWLDAEFVDANMVK